MSTIDPKCRGIHAALDDAAAACVQRYVRGSSCRRGLSKRLLARCSTLGTARDVANELRVCAKWLRCGSAEEYEECAALLLQVGHAIWRRSHERHTRRLSCPIELEWDSLEDEAYDALATTFSSSLSRHVLTIRELDVIHLVRD